MIRQSFNFPSYFYSVLASALRARSTILWSETVVPNNDCLQLSVSDFQSPDLSENLRFYSNGL